MSVSEVKEHDTSAVGEVTKRDLRSMALRWMFFQTSCWNWERMQHMGFVAALLPALRKIYPRQEDLIEAMRRHMVFFNTEPAVGSGIVGLTAALEAERAAGNEVSDETMTAVKTGLMGPLAAIGDSLWASATNAVLLSVGMALALEGSLFGPLFFALSWSVLAIALIWISVSRSWRLGVRLLDGGHFTPERMNQATELMMILGLAVIGGLAAQFVNVETAAGWTISEETTRLQDTLDSLIPGLVPLIVVAVMWLLHQYRRWSALRLVALAVVIGVLGQLTGFVVVAG